MAEKLFKEFPPVSTQQWEEVITKDLKGADYEKRLIWKSMEGINVRPYYRAEDLDKIEHLNTLPGQFPFVRGVKNENNWKIRQSYSALDSYPQANQLALDGIEKGVDSVAFCINGCTPINLDEMNQLLQGIDLSRVEINFRGCSCETVTILKSFIDTAQARGYSADQIKASFDYDPLRSLTTTGNYSCSNFMDILTKSLEISEKYPGIKVIGVEGYAFNNAGSSIVQELGFALAAGSEYLALLTQKGFKADLVASKIKFTLSVGSSYFMEIAKFRAARLLWANITQSYGVENENNQKIDIHALTSQWNQTVYDSYVNLLRSTTEAMSAALAGVNSLEVLPFDFQYREPSEFSNRIARNIQIILKEESYFDKIADPSAGSYYIENLTKSIAEESWKLFREVEERDGYTQSFKDGFIQSQIIATASKRDKNIATRRETLLGTNQYPNFTEKSDKDVTLDVVTRGSDSNVSETPIAQPLEKYRGAQPFEALRFTTESSGKSPKAFMLTFGNLAFCRARAQFSCNFFAVAGFDVIDNNRFSSIEEGVEAALKAKADIVVACSSDEEYAQAVPQIKKLLGDKAILVVAGEPSCKDDLMAQGITNFISVKSNVLETLKEYQNKLGI